MTGWIGALAAFCQAINVESSLTCGHELLPVTKIIISQTSAQEDISPQGGWSHSMT